MPDLIENTPPKPAPINPPLGRHCVICGASLKGTRRWRYCPAEGTARQAENRMYQRKHRTRLREYWRTRQQARKSNAN